MARIRDILLALAIAACGSMLCWRPARGAEPANPSSVTQPGAPVNTAPSKLVVTVGKSLIIDSPLEIRRLSVANGDLAEAVAINPKEVLINGKAPGETSVIVWQKDGARLIYDLTVRMSNMKLEAVRQQLARDFPNEDINVTFENDSAFVRGTVHDMTAADRVMAIVGTLGKSINLLHVDVPPVEQQIVLKVKFANVDRAASSQLGANFFSTAFNQKTGIGTGSVISTDGGKSITVGSAINILLQRPDINLASVITALQSKRVIEMLAEPNLLAISGQQASFLAGGEFPFPIVQPNSSGSAISIMWREYGVRLTFQPDVTPRGTIRLKVAPEVSSLDYAHSTTVQGVTIPGLASRKLQTEVELESGQSFVIGGLLDNQTTESLAKVPGIGSIPVLGKLFQSKQVDRNNSELLVIITPEVVRPIPAGQAAPGLNYTVDFLAPNTPAGVFSQPGVDKTGPVPVKPPVDNVPVEQLKRKDNNQGSTMPPVYQLVPMPAAPPSGASQGPPAAPAAAPAAAPGGPGK